MLPRSLLPHCLFKTFLFIVGLCSVSPTLLWAQGQLENPQPSSWQSGIGIVSGWKCTAGAITIQFDNGPPYSAAYGTIREDTQGVCGDTNNGWAMLWNWNRLGDGVHTIRIFDNGVQFGVTTFTVHTLGEEFRRGLSKSVTIPNFPSLGKDTTLKWDEAQQNFVVREVTNTPPSGGGGGTGIDYNCHPGSGCCSHHGGVAYCVANSVICEDGSTSPTCHP